MLLITVATNVSFFRPDAIAQESRHDPKRPVSVDDASLLIDKQSSIRIAIERDSKVRILIDHTFLQVPRDEASHSSHLCCGRPEIACRATTSAAKGF
jgi:hypothetical protein